MSSKQPGKAAGIEEMYKIVCGIISRPESAAFREPVDWKRLGLLDYPDIIKSPMDLGTVKYRIEADKYQTIDEIALDVRQVWQNCMIYNRDGSEFYHLADKFAKGFEEAFAAFRRMEGSQQDTERIPTVEEKMQLSYDIFKVGNIEMARVLTMVEAVCPSALSRRVSTDELLINIDALTPHCFHEVNAFVLSCVLNSSSGVKGGKSKKKKSEA